MKKIVMEQRTNSSWIANTRYGELSLCSKYLYHIAGWPDDNNQRTELTLLVSGKPQSNFTLVTFQRRNHFDFWNWDIVGVTVKDIAHRYFGCAERVITGLLCNLKHYKANKLPKVVKIWVRVSGE